MRRLGIASMFVHRVASGRACPVVRRLDAPLAAAHRRWRGRLGLRSLSDVAGLQRRGSSMPAPPGLERVLGYVQENDREFLEGVNHGLGKAAKDAGRPTSVCGGERRAKAAAEIQAFLDAHVAGNRCTSSDPTVSRHCGESSGRGPLSARSAAAGDAAPQRAPVATGKVLADAAIDYINSELGGKAAWCCDGGLVAVSRAAIRRRCGMNCSRLPGSTLSPTSRRARCKQGG